MVETEHKRIEAEIAKEQKVVTVKSGSTAKGSKDKSKKGDSKGNTSKSDIDKK